MFSFPRLVLIVSALLANTAFAAPPAQSIGRPATRAEIKAWDIDVRPDFRGLPKGSGTVAKGQDVWEAKCAACHGIFGESNEVFTPIVGGTTKKDIDTGRVAGLISGKEAQRTTLMKLSSLSTLWDYINRAMPWTAPKTLTTEEVYAVTAYILHLGDVLPVDFTLSDGNIADVEKRLPNRNGMTRDHGLWSAKGKGDVLAIACIANCTPQIVTSGLPDFARNAHGNLAAQQRLVGPTRGIDSTQAAPTVYDSDRVKTLAQSAFQASRAAATSSSASDFAAVKKLANDSACMGCHGAAQRIVGPSFAEIAQKYQGNAKAPELLTGKIKNGGSGVWGATPMPPSAQLSASQAQQLATWVLAGAP